MIGKTVSHYRIIEKLGEGGMGVVYKAEDLKLNRFVALKFLPPHVSDDEATQRFVNEAHAVSALDHPNICAIYEIDQTPEGQMFIAMPCYEGASLQEMIKKGPLALDEAVWIASQIAKGLAKAHEKGIVHRDVKPGNILVTSDGLAKIVDFGLAKLATQARLTRVGTTVGTTMYMSPEQASGLEADERSDIWSLGVVLYEMATGRPPFEGEHEQAIIYSILNDTPEPVGRLLPGAPKDLERILTKALAKNLTERYQRMSEMAADLDLLKDGLATKAKASATPARRAMRPRVLIGLAAAVVIAVLAVVLGRPHLSKPHEKPITSIAVLPLENLSADPEQEYFSDGMTEAIIKELSQIKALRVISRTSAMRYKNTDKTIPQIARELGVDAIVEGSVLRADHDVRITAQLIAANPERHLWAKDFTRSLENVLLLQSEVAQAIAVEIRIAVTPNEQERIARAQRVDPEAHEAYLKGEYFVNKAVPADVYKGIPYFQQAIARDSTYALAYAGLAKAYGYLMGLGELSPREGFPKVRTYVEKTLALDSTLAEGIGLMGDVKFSYEWDVKGAEEYFRRAIELNPNIADVHLSYGWLLAGQGRFGAGIEEMRQARQMDPLSVVMTQQLAYVYASAGEYDSALTYAQRAAEIDSTFPNIAVVRCYVYLAQGAYPKAIAEARKLSLGKSSYAFRYLAIAYALSGQNDKARDALASLLAWKGDHYVSSFDVAGVYCALGDRERVFEYLEKAYEERDDNLIQPALMPPWWDFVKSDPRYKELMRRAGVKQ
ncbi:MAG: protein kinase [Candidatus Krumholzibacteria bacterium]|nr:protein kinase [Candidatus Krumholzibacteria bacterium]